MDDITQYFTHKADDEKVKEYNELVNFFTDSDLLSYEFSKVLKEKSGLTIADVLKQFALNQVELMNELSDWKMLKNSVMDSDMFPHDKVRKLLDRLHLKDASYGKVMAIYVAASDIEQGKADKLVAKYNKHMRRVAETLGTEGIRILFICDDDEKHMHHIKIESTKLSHYLKFLGDWRWVANEYDSSGFVFDDIKKVYSRYVDNSDNPLLKQLNNVTHKIHHLLDMVDTDDYHTVAQLVLQAVQGMEDCTAIVH